MVKPIAKNHHSFFESEDALFAVLKGMQDAFTLEDKRVCKRKKIRELFLFS